MWFIVSIVTALAFGDHPHTITSNMHFETQAACEAYRPADAAELADELHGIGIELPLIDSHCEIDLTGEPV